ncbi:DNA repair protein XRCC3 [Acrasis kona]|uniref:DNA repair protein XRCC3 n=1 Tax=Acrasis kona TaxID=1008807 RepID=A0AAW2ZL32_9EUKA
MKQVTTSQKEDVDLLIDTMNAYEEDSQNDSQNESQSQDLYSMAEVAFDGQRGKIRIEDVFSGKIETSFRYPLQPLVENGTAKPFPTKEQFTRALQNMKIFNLEALATYAANYPRNELLNKLNERGNRYSHSHVDFILYDLSAICLPRPLLDCSTLLNRCREMPNILSTGDQILDFSLNGGLRTRCSVELAGDAGSGKSQLCLQLAIQSLLPMELGGLEGRALFLNSETLSIGRLRELAGYKLKQIKGLLHEHETGSHPLNERTVELISNFNKIEDITDNIMMQVIGDHAHFRESVKMLNKFICDVKNQHESMFPRVGLVVVDSIASWYRNDKDFQDEGGAKNRSSQLFEIANEFKIIADQHNLCVVFVNQVTSDMSFEHGVKLAVGQNCVNDISTLQSKLYSSAADRYDDPDDPRRMIRNTHIMHNKIKPALGLAWTNCVNASILLTKIQVNLKSERAYKKSKIERDERSGIIYMHHENVEDVSSVSRYLHVVFAPFVKSNSSMFVVLPTGVEGIN